MASNDTDDFKEIDLCRDMDEFVFVDLTPLAREIEVSNLRQQYEDKLAAQEESEETSDEELEEDRKRRIEEKVLKNKNFPFVARRPPKGFSTWSEYVSWNRRGPQMNFEDKRRASEVGEALWCKEYEEFSKFGNNVTDALMWMPRLNVASCMAEIEMVLKKYRYDSFEEM
ncbi:hypothetical protein HHI36_008181 [Cryptolaemus montrouzieri]|uniref:Uncharacterized protein n=1 Tax=Cryptolaemus montrouzieri TaxID=559131 RepID=A0ABD2MRS4_9CUCU